MHRRLVPKRLALPTRTVVVAVSIAAGASACIVSFGDYKPAPDGGTGGAAQSTSTDTSTSSHGSASATSSANSTTSSSTGSSSTGSSSGSSSTTSSSTASSSTTSSSTASSSSSGACTGTLDPKLVLPAPGGQACGYPGDPNCPVNKNCRISGPCSETCEGCVECRSTTQPCTVDTNCAGFAQCYNGKCFGLCKLAAPNCGGGQTCTSVGNSVRGLCMP